MYIYKCDYLSWARQLMQQSGLLCVCVCLLTLNIRKENELKECASYAIEFNGQCARLKLL